MPVEIRSEFAEEEAERREIEKKHKDTVGFAFSLTVLRGQKLNDE